MSMGDSPIKGRPCLFKIKFSAIAVIALVGATIAPLFPTI